MGILDFLLDGKKKKPEIPLPANVPAPTPLSSSGAGSVLSAPEPLKVGSLLPKPVAPAIKPKVENVHMNDALNLKGMIPDETLYSGNNEYIKEAAAQRYRQLLHTEFATPDETGLPSWLQTPLQKAHQYTAAGAGYMGDTLQGVLGLAGVAKTSKAREAVLPEQELRRIEDYLGKYDPHMLTDLVSEKAISGFSPVANTVGAGAAAFGQAYVAAMPVAKVLSSVPALNAIRAGTYGARGIYAMNVLDNAAGAVSAQMLHGLTREADLKTVARRVAASPSILLPFHNNAMVGVGGIADYFAGKYFLKMSDSQALTHALVNLGPNVLRRMQVAGQVQQFNDDMTQVRGYFDGNLEKQGVPKMLRDEVMDSAQKIYAYRKGNPTDFDGVAKLYDQEGSRLQGVFKEYSKTYGVGEQRLVGLNGPEGNPLLPQGSSAPLPRGEHARQVDLLAEYYNKTPDEILSAIKESGTADNTKIDNFLGAKFGKDSAGFTDFVDQKLGGDAKIGDYNAVEAARLDTLKPDFRLPAQIKKGDVIDIPLDRITFDPRQITDASIDTEGSVNAQAPIKVVESGNKILLYDGNHRLLDALKNGETSIKAQFIENPTAGKSFDVTAAKLPSELQPASSFPSIFPNTTSVPTAPGGLGSILSAQSPSQKAAQSQNAGQSAQTPPPQSGKTLQQQLARTDTSGGGQNGGGAEPLDDIIRKYPTPVENKVHILDYLATPETVMKKIGLGHEMLALRRADEAYRKELPIQIDRVRQWVDRTKGEPDASKRIFQYLDGDKTVHLDTNEMGVAKEMQDWFTMWAQRQNLPPEKTMTNYITHIFDTQKATEFDEDMAKLIADKVPKEVYNPFLKKREGMPGFKQDAFLAAEIYAKRATRKVNLDPALEKINKSAQGLEEKTYQYVKRYAQEVNLRPIETDVLTDNLIKSALQNVGIDPYKFGARPTNVILRGQRQMIYRGLIGGNVGSAIRNLTQGVNTYSDLGERYTTIGYSKLLTEAMSGRASQELKDNVVLGMDIAHQDRVLSARQKLTQAGDKALFSAFNMAEFINRGAAYYGAKSMYLDMAKKAGAGVNVKGVSQKEFDDLILAKKPDSAAMAQLNEDQTLQFAVERAKGIVRKTQFQFGPIDAPLVMRGDVAKSLLQLQGFTMKQAEFLTNKVLVDKDIGGMLRYTAGSIAVLATVGKALGLEGKDFMPGVRFLEGGSGPPMMQFPAGVASAVLNIPDKYGRVSQENTLNRIIGSPAVQRGAMMYVPGGAQMQKTAAGMEAYGAGEKRSKSGKSQTFPIEQDLDNFVRSFIYGPYGTKEGRDYIEQNLKAPGLMDRILGSDTGGGSTVVPKSRYTVPSGGGVPKSKYAVPKR